MSVAAALASLLLLLLARNVITHPPKYDELLHVLSARGVVETGQPVIADGHYDRAELFTRMVAASFKWRGESLESARLPALIAALALIVLLASWATSRAGLIAGTSAAVLLAISVTTIGLATFARFYTLHALAVAIMAVGLYEGTARDRALLTRLVLIGVAVLAAAVAVHLQITTVVAIGATLTGLGVVSIVDRRLRVAAIIRARPLLFSTLLIATLAVLALLEWKVHLISYATEAPLWAEDRASRPLFYVQQLAVDLPLFWPLFPLAAVAAISVSARFGVFCIVLALSALVVHSIAAAREMRYVYYTMPFVCALLGCGVAVAVKVMTRWLSGALPQLDKAALPLALGILAVSVSFSQEGQRTLRFIAKSNAAQSITMYATESNWALALPILQPLADTADLVIVSAGVKGLYYFGRYDFELNSSVVMESESGKEFGRDPRTGREVIGTRDSLAAVLARAGTKLVVIDQNRLGRETAVVPAAVTLIEAQCHPLVLPQESRVFAWTC